MSESRTQEREDPFGSMFEIALVLLGILSATETPYFVKAWNDATALKFAVYPFLLMIFLWLVNGLYKRQFERENIVKLWLLLSESCWEIWSFSLSFYLLFLALHLVPFPAIDLSYAGIIGGIMLVLVLKAYALEYKKEFPDYYSRKWKLIRGICMILVVLGVYAIFLP